MPTAEIRASGDLFDIGADAVVIPVNTRGAMGAGLARAFAGRFPASTALYRTRCREGWEPGTIRFAHGTRDLARADINVAVFFPTKLDWRNPSELDWIRRGLDDLAAFFGPTGDATPAKLVAIPALGCGLGGLPWDDVRPLIEHAARRMLCAKRVVVFEPREGR